MANNYNKNNKFDSVSLDIEFEKILFEAKEIEKEALPVSNVNEDDEKGFEFEIKTFSPPPYEEIMEKIKKIQEMKITPKPKEENIKLKQTISAPISTLKELPKKDKIDKNKKEVLKFIEEQKKDASKQKKEEMQNEFDIEIAKEQENQIQMKLAELKERLKEKKTQVEKMQQKNESIQKDNEIEQIDKGEVESSKYELEQKKEDALESFEKNVEQATKISPPNIFAKIKKKVQKKQEKRQKNKKIEKETEPEKEKQKTKEEEILTEPGKDLKKEKTIRSIIASESKKEAETGKESKTQELEEFEFLGPKITPYKGSEKREVIQPKGKDKKLEKEIKETKKEKTEALLTISSEKEEPQYQIKKENVQKITFEPPIPPIKKMEVGALPSKKEEQKEQQKKDQDLYFLKENEGSINQNLAKKLRIRMPLKTQKVIGKVIGEEKTIQNEEKEKNMIGNYIEDKKVEEKKEEIEKIREISNISKEAKELLEGKKEEKKDVEEHQPEIYIAYAKENVRWLYEIYKIGGISFDEFKAKIKEKMAQVKNNSNNDEQLNNLTSTKDNLEDKKNSVDSKKFKK